MADLAPETRERLKRLRDELLPQHKSLMDMQRTDHESVHGPVDRGILLRLLLEDASFEWLRDISRLIADIDDLLASKKPVEDTSGHALLNRSQALFLASAEATFANRYQAALERSPEVLTRHSMIVAILTG